MAFWKALGAKSGFALITIGCLLIAAGIIAGQLLTLALKQGYFDYPEYSHDKKFDDPSYEECKNKTLSVWFWNLTNSDELMAGIDALPEYVEAGPYNFTRRSCEYENHAVDEWEYFRKYYETAYVFSTGEGLSADDMIVNFNPGYLAIMKQIQAQTGSDQNLETALVAQMAGGALQQVIEGFQSNTFGSQVRVGAIPTFLTTVRTQVIPRMEASVRAILVTQQIQGIVGALQTNFGLTQAQAEDAFFNDPSVPGGLAAAYGSLNFSAASQDLILHGTPPTEPRGLLVDVVPPIGQGVLTFLGTLQNPTAAAAYAMAVGVTNTQLNILGAYIGQDLYVTGANNNVPGGAAGITAIATGKFYNQWVNSTSGLDLNGDTIPFDGFEVGSDFTYFNISVVGIDADSAVMLWDTGDTQSLVTLPGIQGWFAAAQLAAGGNFSLAGPLIAKYGLTTQQVQALFRWLGNLESRVMVDVVLQQFGVASFDELAYLQWGTSNVLLGASAADFDPSIPAPPEFGYHMGVISNPTRFSAARSEALLNGTRGFFNGANIGMFLQLAALGQFTTINTLWGLNAPETGALAAYFNYFFGAFIDSLLQGQMFPAGAGPITARKPVDWIWTGTDPLVEFLGFPPNVGILYSSSEALSRAEADSQTVYHQRSIFRGGSLKERTASQEVKFYPNYPPGNATVNDIWAGPLEVKGNYDGVFWPPGVSKDDVLTAWLDELIRPIDFEYWENSKVKGIDVYLFKATDKLYASDPFYFQQEGLLNLSSSKPVNLYVSRPHFYGVADESIRNGVIGMDPTDPSYGNTYFGVNPESGFGVLKVAPIQAVFEIPPMTRYFPGLNVTRFVPILYSDYRDEISDEDADDLKRIVATANAAIISSYVIGIVLGALLLGFGIFVCVQWNGRRARGEEANIEVELPSK